MPVKVHPVSGQSRRAKTMDRMRRRNAPLFSSFKFGYWTVIWSRLQKKTARMTPDAILLWVTQAELWIYRT